MTDAVTHDRLLHLLRYDKETGHFFWRSPVSRKVKAGDRAGWSAGVYHRIKLDGVDYFAHRLAWLYVTGSWPKEHIDHINGNPADNRFENLREANPSQNLANQKRNTANTSGHKGVSWHKAAKKWSAYIKVNGKRRHLGLFHDKAEAAQAYASAALRLHGVFARAA